MLTIIFIIAIVLSVVGIIGSVLPALPGPPINFAALLLVYFGVDGSIGTTTLIVLLALTLLVVAFDYVAPVWFTHAGGGSKLATYGSTAGLIVGLFFMPWGMIVGPLIGAIIGELIAGSNIGKSLKVGLLSFLSFIVTTGIKVVLSVIMTIYIIKAAIAAI